MLLKIDEIYSKSFSIQVRKMISKNGNLLLFVKTKTFC